MKVLVDKDTKVCINGKDLLIESGSLELEENIAQILINAGYAKEIEEKKSKK
ncbi:MAG: hypothetical protein NZZ41_03285 [Candidatus Dojkabacteria bacterium]|nr:hypothetical protein [Candidatus Dojkabacteria bacterium]